MAVWLAAPGAWIARAEITAGQALPDLTRFGLEGRLPDTKGKVVVLDFWASWCAPCKASFPALQRLQNQYKSRGLEIIAVNMDKKREALDRFLAEYPVTFTIVRDAQTRLAETVEPQAMPTTLVVDRRGKVVARHSGYQGEETERALAEEIEKCLLEKP